MCKRVKRKVKLQVISSCSEEDIFNLVDNMFQLISLFFLSRLIDRLFTYLLNIKGTNGRQKTCEIFHVYCIFYSSFMCQATVIFGITKDGSLVLNPLAS